MSDLLNENSDQATIVDWLNNASVSNVAMERIKLLTKAQEYLLRKNPELLLELLTDFLGFVTDRNSDVKKTVVGFIEEACKQTELVIPKIVLNLHMLLCDESVKVQKRVIQASSSIYRKMMVWLCTSQVISEDMEQAWNGLNRIKVEIVNMIDSDNDGVRTHSIKFLELVVLLQTYPDKHSPRKENDFSLEDIPLTLKIARRRKLEEEANHIFSLLVKFHGSPHISSVNLMACMGSLCNIGKLRPEFMSKVIEALENLLLNLPPTLSDSQVSSVKKQLKLQLINILKHPSSLDHKASIASILADVGCSPQEIARLVPRLAQENKQRMLKRSTDPPAPPAVKKPRLVQELEMKMEESERVKQKSSEINRQFIIDNLNVNVASHMIFATMKNVPNVMPINFPSEYSKVFNSENIVTVKDIAKLLGEQFTEANVGPGAKVIAADVLPLPLSLPLPLPPVPVTKAEVEIVQMKEYKEETVDKQIEKVAKEVKAGRVSKPRVKNLKLAEITRPLKRELCVQMLIDSVQRLLHSEKAAVKVGIAHTRYKIITTLAATFSAPVRKAVLSYLLMDMRTHMDLALAWLYEEYSLMQGFNRSPAILKRDQKPDQSYSTLLCALANSVMMSDVKDRDGLLARLFLEAPLLTEEALELLREMCTLSDRCVTGLNLMHDLVVRRPPKGKIYLSTLLSFSIYEDLTIREEAVARVISLYERVEWQEHIEKFAMEYLQMLQQPKPPHTLFGNNTGRQIKQEVWSDELNRVCLCLYLSLLPYNENLIHELAKVYTQTSPDIKRTILRLLEQPVRGMGMDSPELLALVEKCPKGSETLVTRIIHILSDRGPPSAQLVTRVRELYQSRVSDVRFLIPVLNGLTKKEVISALPKLIKLNPVVVKEVFNRLLGIHGESPITPSELLIALHLIDPSKAEIKAVMKATSLCFSEKQIYTQEVLAVVMQQLMEINPLPTLLMRTVIQSLSLYSRLTGFIMNILQRLIVKQVWRQKVVWEGFIKCCQRTKPQSFQVLLQLPPPQLSEALTVCPDMKQPLYEHVHGLTEAQKAHVPASTMEVLREEPSATPGTVLETLPELKPIVAADEPLPPGMD